MRRSPRRRCGFTLLEVLLALGLAALVLGALLRSAGLDLAHVRRAVPRYRILTGAAAILESRLDEGFSGREKGTTGSFEFLLESATVPADPRVERMQIEVTGGGLHQTLAAYRLKVRRREPPPPRPDTGSSPSSGSGTAPSPSPSEAGP